MLALSRRRALPRRVHRQHAAEGIELPLVGDERAVGVPGELQGILKRIIPVGERIIDTLPQQL